MRSCERLTSASALACSSSTASTLVWAGRASGKATATAVTVAKAAKPRGFGLLTISILRSRMPGSASSPRPLRRVHPAHDLDEGGGELARQLDVAVMRHRHVEQHQANRRVRIAAAKLLRDEHLPAVERRLGNPVVAIEARDRPYHLVEAVHSRERRAEEIRADVLDVDAPRVACLVEQRLDLPLDLAFVNPARAVLEVLQRLLEVRPAVALRLEPALRDLERGHARLVERVQPAAVVPRVADRVAAGQHVDGAHLPSIAALARLLRFLQAA